MKGSYPIPADAFDDRLSWIGTSGTGKTYDAGTAVERVLRLGSRVCIVDPLGVWWGLRLKSDGKTASSFNVAIFGGPHGDIAITETSGKLIGEAVAGTTESCIIDLSEFDTDASQRRFMLAFLVALYGGLKGDLLHLVLDEADMWAPQRILDKEGDATRLHHNVQKIVRRGRVKGFIPWLITQRPAEISKSILSMTDGMVMHQALSPQDIGAVMDWVSKRADKATAKDIESGLPAFERGQAAVYIPRRKVLSIAQFPLKTTFDSSAAPERGQKKNRPDLVLKRLDIDKLKKRLDKVEAEAKANDPKALRTEILWLNAELRKKMPAGKAAPDPQAIEQAEQRGYAKGYSRGKIDGYGDAMTGVSAEFANVVAALASFDQQVKNIRASAAVVERWAKKPPPKSSTAIPAGSPAPGHAGAKALMQQAGKPVHAPVVMPARPATSSPVASGDGTLTNPQRELLRALMWWNSMGFDQPTRTQTAAIAGWKPKGSNLRNRLSELSSLGLVTYPRDGAVALTTEGAAAAPTPDMSRTIVDSLRGIMTGPQRTVFDWLLGTTQLPVTRDDIAEGIGWEPGGSNLRNRLSELSALEVVEYPAKGDVTLQTWVLDGAALGRAA